MVDLAREAVGRQPFGHGIRIEEGAKDLLRLGGEDTMQADGISGHDVGTPWPSGGCDKWVLAQLLLQGRPASSAADIEAEIFGSWQDFGFMTERAE